MASYTPLIAQLILDRGNAEGSALSQMGQTIGGIPQQMARQRDQDLRAQQMGLQSQMAQMQIGQMQREQASQDAFRAAMQSARNPDGSVDHVKVANYLDQYDPIKASAYREGDLKTQETQLAIKGLTQQQATTAQQLAQAKRDQIATYATIAQKKLGTLDANGNPDALGARDAGSALVQHGIASGVVSPDDGQQFTLQSAQASPDQLRALYQGYIDQGSPAFQEKQLQDQKTQSEIKKNLWEAQKAAPTKTLPEQLLDATLAGDTAKRAMILKTVTDNANASRDPAAMQLAQQLGGLRADELRAKIAADAEKAKPLNIDSEIQTTVAGRKYLDLSTYGEQTGDRDRARRAAEQAGVVPVRKEVAEGISNIDATRMTQRDILNQIEDALPRDASGRLVKTVTVPLSKLFQTNAQLASYGTWRNAAISTLRAVAGSKGLRINQPEIKMAMENDIPLLTDTYGTALAKVDHINTLLEDIERSNLVHNRSVYAAPPPMNADPYR